MKGEWTQTRQNINLCKVQMTVMFGGTMAAKIEKLKQLDKIDTDIETDKLTIFDSPMSLHFEILS